MIKFKFNLLIKMSFNGFTQKQQHHKILYAQRKGIYECLDNRGVELNQPLTMNYYWMATKQI